MLRYAGQLSGLYPSDPYEALLVDEMVGAIEDVITAVVPSLREQDKDKQVGGYVGQAGCRLDSYRSTNAYTYTPHQHYSHQHTSSRCARSWPRRRTPSGSR